MGCCVALVLACGCASNKSDADYSRPGEGIKAYSDIAREAGESIKASLNSLATVSAQSNQCAPDVLSRFSQELERLTVRSIQVRARAQAMEARGEAYFERWHQHLAQVKDSRVRALAQKERPRLEASFRRVKELSAEARAAFQTFSSNLRRVRNGLELDPGSLGSEATQGWISEARQHGQQVIRHLAAIVAELDSAQAMITPPGRPLKDEH